MDNYMMNVLVIAAHPDDEVLGMGGTIKKLSKKNNVFLCVVSEGATAQYEDKKMIKIRETSCIKSGKILGISKFEFLKFPDMRLNDVSHLELNQELETVIKKFKPDVIYTCPSNDLNKDHQQVFESTLVASRPFKNTVKSILSYEIPSIVKTPFLPTVYEDISKEISFKIKAFKCYKSEVEQFPHPRSIPVIKSLSILRGMESGLMAAESFQLIRHIS